MSLQPIVTETHCHFCGHVHAAAEMADNWCAACGRKIPEMLLAFARDASHFSDSIAPNSDVSRGEEFGEGGASIAGALLAIGRRFWASRR